MKQEAIYPDWNTKALYIKRVVGNLTEYDLFSYNTWVCTYQEWVTKPGYVQRAIRFNDEPYQASRTTARHLKWFLQEVVNYDIVQDLTDDGKKSCVKIMCESPNKVYYA